MVAYSFRPLFVPQIQAGLKRQTIRAHRRRHARPGEPVQIYTGMRTRHCRKIVDPDPLCVGVDEIVIWVSLEADNNNGRITINLNGQTLDRASTAALAVADGFLVERWDPDEWDSWQESFPGDAAGAMAQWWLHMHGAGRFDGVLIRWSEREMHDG